MPVEETRFAGADYGIASGSRPDLASTSILNGSLQRYYTPAETYRVERNSPFIRIGYFDSISVLGTNRWMNGCLTFDLSNIDASRVTAAELRLFPESENFGSPGVHINDYSFNVYAWSFATWQGISGPLDWPTIEGGTGVLCGNISASEVRDIGTQITFSSATLLGRVTACIDGNAPGEQRLDIWIEPHGRTKDTEGETRISSDNSATPDNRPQLVLTLSDLATPPGEDQIPVTVSRGKAETKISGEGAPPAPVSSGSLQVTLEED